MQNVAEGFSLRKGKVGSIPQFCWMNLQKETFNKGGKMKKCKALLSLTIGLAIGLGFVGKVNAETYKVDCDSTADMDTTITQALVKVDEYDTILVYPGTYDVTLGETFPLELDSTGLVLISTTGAAACTIDASAETGGGAVIYIQTEVNDVTIGGAGVGFTMIVPNSGGDEYGVNIGLGCDRVTVQDNIICGKVLVGVHLWGKGAAEGHYDIVIKDNTITSTHAETSPPGNCYGIVTAPVGVYTVCLFGANSSIDGNTIYGFKGCPIYLDAVHGESTTNPIVISNNELYDNTCHGLVVVGDNVSITGNTIYNNTKNGLSIYVEDASQTTEEIVVEENSIYSNTAWGIKLYTNVDATSVNVNENNIYSNTAGGLSADGGDGICPATCNWWGDESGPEYGPKNPLGRGDEISDSVTYIPWLDDEFATGECTGGIPTHMCMFECPSPVQAGATSPVIVTLQDEHNNPVPDSIIDFSVNGNGWIVSPHFDITDSLGHATASFHGEVVGSDTVIAQMRGDPTINAPCYIEVTPGPVCRVRTTPAETVVVVTEVVTIVAELVDCYDNHIAAGSVDDVNFTTNDSALGTLGAKALNADSNVQIPYTTHCMVESERDTIIATTTVGGYTDSSVVSTIGGPPKTMKFRAADDSVVVSDHDSTVALHDTLFDLYGNKSVYSDYYASSNRFYEVDLSVLPSGPAFTDTTPAVVGINGYCGTNYWSYKVIGPYWVTATSGDATANVLITQTPDVVASLSLIPDTVWMAAGQDTILTAKLFDQFANPVKATDTSWVDFSIAVCQLCTLGVKELDAAGNVTVRYTACPTAADTATIVAVTDPTAAPDTIPSVFKDTSVVINAAPGALHHFALEFTGADSIDAGTGKDITITAEDIADARIWTYTNPDTVTLTLDGSAAGSTQVEWTIATVVTYGLTASIPELSFTGGQLSFKVLNQKAETDTVTAVDTAGHTGTTYPITWIPINLNYFGVVAHGSSIYTGVPFTLAVTPYDTFSNVTGVGLPVWIEFSANELDVTLPNGAQQLTVTGVTDYTALAKKPTTSLIITAYTISGAAIYGSTVPITVLKAVIDAPDTIIATDVPGDNGYFVDLVWDFSANHPGIGDYNVIDYYQLYYAPLDTLGAEIDLYTGKTVTATDTTGTGNDAVRVRVFTPFTGDVHYYVQAVMDNAYKGTEGVSGQWVKLADYHPKGNQLVSELTGPVTVEIIDNIAPTGATFARAMDTRDDAGSSATVTWNLSPDDEIVFEDPDEEVIIYGVTSYRVYRKAQSKADYEYVGYAPRKTAEYVDETVGNYPDIYDYTVYAYDGSNLSVVSNSDYGMAAINDVQIGDFTSDGAVDLTDFSFFVDHYGLVEATDITFDWLYDLSEDGAIDLTDFSLFIDHYGEGTKEVLSSGENAGAELVIESTSLKDSELEVRVIAKNVSNLAGYQFELVYNDKLTYKSVSAGDFLTSQGGKIPLFLVKPSDGSILVANVIKSPTKELAPDGNGVLAVFRFTSNGAAEFGLANIELIDADRNVNILSSFGIAEAKPLPTRYELWQNSPNPFIGSTAIKYAILNSGKVEIAIYNVVGQKVRTLVNSPKDAGYYTISWNGTDDRGSKLSEGIYFYRIVAGKFTSLKKLILLIR